MNIWSAISAVAAAIGAANEQMGVETAGPLPAKLCCTGLGLGIPNDALSVRPSSTTLSTASTACSASSRDAYVMQQRKLGGPLVVSSAYRNVSYNAGVGGVTYSRHQYGDAVDLQTQMTDLESLAELCDLYVASFVSVYESHVHCDWRDDPLEPAFYDSEFSGSSTLSPQIFRSLEGWTTTVGPFTEGQPLREWAAFDAQGRLLVIENGRTFSPPPKSHRLSVRVGGQIDLSADL